MPAYDWSRFELRINVNAPVELIYRAWATQSGMESWFLRSAEFFTTEDRLRQSNESIQKGDRYIWLWHGYGDDTVEHNYILDANGLDSISFVFAGHCMVTVTTGILDTETIIQLVQENIPTADDSKADIHIACLEGWTFYLTNLKSILEGGIDLRNRKVDIGKVINA